MARRYASIAAFTLIEIIVVIAIIGIISAVGIPGYLRWSKITQLRGVTSQISGDLNTLRLAAQKTSRDATIAFSGPGSYTLTYNNGNANVSVSKTIPPDVTLNIYATGEALTGKSIVYTAPYAEVTAPLALQVQRSGNFPKMRVGLAGVTGTVVISEVK